MTQCANRVTVRVTQLSNQGSRCNYLPVVIIRMSRSKREEIMRLAKQLIYLSIDLFIFVAAHVWSYILPASRFDFDPYGICWRRFFFLSPHRYRKIISMYSGNYSCSSVCWQKMPFCKSIRGTAKTFGMELVDFQTWSKPVASRPIMMTSFAVIVGCFRLPGHWRTALATFIGTGAVGGMLYGAIAWSVYIPVLL